MSLHTQPSDHFRDRHLGSVEDTARMLQTIGVNSLDQLIDETVPAAIRMNRELNIPAPAGEHEFLAELRKTAALNKVYRNYIGMGYYPTYTPGVILRNIMENPGWYTQYTPYQAEIAQGRLEALLNYQTMVIDLTGLPVANASLLDEGTAAAEAMHMFQGLKSKEQGEKFFVAKEVYPQTLSVLATRAEPIGVELVVGDPATFEFTSEFFGALLQYPDNNGEVMDYAAFCEKAHAAGAFVAVAADLLSLTLLTPPGEWGADAVIGNTQRFGVPMGYGGPHAAYFSTKEDFKRHMSGRIIGVSIDSHGNQAFRMALQTREQHIRREKATSNICTAQVLLAIMAGMYAVYHGPKGLKSIAERVHGFAKTLEATLTQYGFAQLNKNYFDTLRFQTNGLQDAIRREALQKEINLRYFEDGTVGVALDETTTLAELEILANVFLVAGNKTNGSVSIADLANKQELNWPAQLQRKSDYLSHPVFNTYHSEHEMLRYIKRLEAKDLSLCHSMISLGSCTMKLNATTEMIPVTWPEFNSLHPFAPVDQAQGYAQIFKELDQYLSDITGFAAMSLQPNSGAQGEYAGLMVIREYFKDKGQAHRNIALIPSSAHGTNPASAVMAGMQVVVVKCLEDGSIDMDDLRQKAEQHSANLACLMVTYPSTFGVFDENIREITDLIHQHGGQVYMDGANMNAQVGLTSPGLIGADVCHLNLHKTFCIPHGGGGPGMGPIGVAAHLAPYLPGHPLVKTGGEKSMKAVSAAPWGSASILLISYAYIRMMGAKGLTDATRYAILNANYMKARLEPYYKVLYIGKQGRVAHEMILDTRGFKQSAEVEVEDIAKRLMDYGFHAPTVSFPVAGTVMIEPTESESKAELDRFIEAMIGIRKEIEEIEAGKMDRKDNVLKNAPHTAVSVISDNWNHAYSREKAAYPAPWVLSRKFWPSVGRVNNTHGDRQLICACPPIEEYMDALV